MKSKLVEMVLIALGILESCRWCDSLCLNTIIYCSYCPSQLFLARVTAYENEPITLLSREDELGRKYQLN